MRRILSIDGGGIRGVFPAAFLAELESKVGSPLHEYFDLIAGTSTGGIIALGLGLGFPAACILNFYESEGPKIFSQDQTGMTAKIRKWNRTLRWVCGGPKYDAANLESSLENVFKSRKLGEAHTRLFIPSWHRSTAGLHIFKTAHHPRLKTDYEMLAKDVAMATTSAPTYFKEHVTQEGVGLIDGGVWANNPTGFAVVEGIANLGWRPEDIRVLSIGGLDDLLELKESYSAASIAMSLKNIFMSGQSNSSNAIAQTLLGQVGGTGHNALYRITQTVPANYFSLDDTSKIKELKSRALAEARTAQPNLEPVFFTNKVDPFIPCHQVGERL